MGKRGFSFENEDKVKRELPNLSNFIWLVIGL